MQNRLIELALFYPLFLFSLSFHEAAHAYVSYKLGDGTAKYLGRVSLSPLPHIDLIGTVVLPILGILTHAPIIGWGKPVPVNPYNLKGDTRRSSLWVALAGPVSNIILALVFGIIAHLIVYGVNYLPAGMIVQGGFVGTSIKTAFTISQMGVLLNLVLAFFNLIPLVPLDGGTVLRGLLPNSLLDGYDNLMRYGFIILVVLFISNALRFVLGPVYLLAYLIMPNV